MRRICIAVFCSISVFICMLLPVVECRLMDVQKTSPDHDRDTHVIEAASPYEYGLSVGTLFNPQFRVLHVLTRLSNGPRIDHQYVEDQLRTIEQDFPYFLDELRGVSTSTGITIQHLIAIQYMLYSVCLGECTIALATGTATKDNQTFLLFNMDSSVETMKEWFVSTLLHRLYSMVWWVVRIRTMDYAYAFWGIPVILEYPFLNEKGLGWGSPGTVFTDNESRPIDEGPGMPTMMLETFAMMTCKNVSEVACLYRETERASPKKDAWPHMYDSSSSCFCDSNGGILCIEQTHQYILTVFGNSTDITGARAGILWHANHHQWLDPSLTGSVYPNEYPSSALRAERTKELLLDEYGNITLDVCKRISRDHDAGFDPREKDSGDICRHPDTHTSKITAFSWIIMPKEMTVYWTHTAPCKGKFFTYNFSSVFDL